MPPFLTLQNGLPFLSVTGDTDLNAWSQVVGADASGGSPLYVNLPSANQSNRSVEVTVSNTGATGTVIIDAFGTDTIEGAATYELTDQWETVTLVSVGSGWVVTGTGIAGVEIYDDTNPNLGVSTFQGAVESLLDGAPTTTYIFNSSGIEGGVRFNTWTNLMNAIANSRYGGPRNILFEQNEGPAIPAGSYDLTDIRLLGNGFGILNGGLTLTLGTGVQFTNDLLDIGGGLFLNFAGTNTLMDGYDTPGALKILRLFNRAAIGCTGGGAIMGIGSDDTVAFPGGLDAEAQIICADGENNIVGGDSTYGAFPGFSGTIVDARCDTSGTKQCVVVDNGWQSVITDGLFSVSGANSLSNTWFLNSPTITPLLAPGFDPTAQTPLSGTLNPPTVARLSSARRVQYIAQGAGLDWAAPTPNTLELAVHRLAVAVADMRDGTFVPGAGPRGIP